MFLIFLQVLRKEPQSFKNLQIWGQILFKVEGMMQSYPQGIWLEDSKEIGPEMQEKALGFLWALW